jgi:hypothetical protein
MSKHIGNAATTQEKKVMRAGRLLDKGYADEVGRGADGRQEPPDTGAVGDHQHQRGAEPEPAHVPIGIGLLANQTTQRAHHAEPNGQKHDGRRRVRDER